MAEFSVYPASQELYDEIMKGKRNDYVLTTRLPRDITVNLGSPVDNRNAFQRLFCKRKYEPVVCIGPTSNARHLLAVNREKVKELGGKLD